VGTRDSALDRVAWPACAGRLRTDLAHVVLGCRAGPTARPMQQSWEALGSPSASLAKGRGALVGV
jgi:hypothetical protein